MERTAKLSRKVRLKRFWSAIRKDRLLYLMVIPGIAYFILFHYVPMYGVTIAFKKYNIYKGFAASDWIGLENFRRLFTMYGFAEAMRNTIIISIGKIIFGFPLLS